MKGFKIGSVRLKNRLILAPMVDVTDLPFRLLCKDAGASLTYTEMLHAQSIIYLNKISKQKLMTIRREKPVGVQITGNTVAQLKKTFPKLEKFSLVDLNCGCPAKLTVGSESGSYLLKDTAKITKMLRAMKEYGFVSTAKIRLGFKFNDVVRIAKAVEKGGADAITVHGRLASQGRSAKADFKEIKKVKDSLGIPVIGNGDVKDGKSAEKMLEVCDGAMIARGAIGDPQVFERILHYLKKGREKEFDLKKNLKLFQKYIDLSKKYDVLHLNRVKYLGGNFIQQFDGAAKVRKEFMGLKNLDEIESFVKNLY